MSFWITDNVLYRDIYNKFFFLLNFIGQILYLN